MNHPIKNLYLVFLPLICFSLNTQRVSAQEPCNCCGETYRQFDFWLGEWVVYQNDQIAGRNTISLAQDSCALIEQWRSANSNYTGTSINFYNATDSTWHQTWVDNQGGILILSGGLTEDGRMVLSSDTLEQPASGKRVHTIEWTPHSDGSVRQYWTVRMIGSDSTSILFDGLYRPVKN